MTGAAQPPDYTIVAERPRGVLAVTFRHFWSPETLLSFRRDADTAVIGLPCAPSRHRTIVDLTAWPVQSQAVVAGMIDYLRTAEPHAARLALVCGPGLIRLQARRAVDPAWMALFDTVAEARIWLDRFDPSGGR